MSTKYYGHSHTEESEIKMMIEFSIKELITINDALSCALDYYDDEKASNNVTKLKDRINKTLRSE